MADERVTETRFGNSTNQLVRTLLTKPLENHKLDMYDLYAPA